MDYADMWYMVAFGVSLPLPCTIDLLFFNPGRPNQLHGPVRGAGGGLHEEVLSERPRSVFLSAHGHPMQIN
jgi:hypothetical protein